MFDGSPLPCILKVRLCFALKEMPDGQEILPHYPKLRLAQRPDTVHQILSYGVYRALLDVDVKKNVVLSYFKVVFVLPLIPEQQDDWDQSSLRTSPKATVCPQLFEWHICYRPFELTLFIVVSYPDMCNKLGLRQCVTLY